MLRCILAVSIFVCSAGAVASQTPAGLPHAWSEAVYALAEKIAPALGPSHEYSVDVKDVSNAAPVDLADIVRTLNEDMAQRGARAVQTPGDAQVRVTVSQSLAAFELVAEIHRGDAQQVAVVPVAATDELPPQPAPRPGIQRKIIWQQAAAILDFAQVSADSRRAIWYFLEPDRLVAYEFDDGTQVLRAGQPISRRHTARDLRGRLVVADATHVIAYVGGVRCDASWNPSFSLECRDNAGQHWPMGPLSWTANPERNYFSSVIFSSSLEAKFPPFFSSASPSPDTTGFSSAHRVVAGLGGQAQLFEGTAEPDATFAGWGSDIVTIDSGCSAAWHVLATGAGDWTERDEIQLYEIRDRRDVAIGEPLQLPGPALALWPADDGKSARLISRSLESGSYEASIVSVSCGN